MFRRKVLWVFIGLFCPEIVLASSFEQWKMSKQLHRWVRGRSRKNSRNTEPPQEGPECQGGNSETRGKASVCHDGGFDSPEKGPICQDGNSGSRGDESVCHDENSESPEEGLVCQSGNSESRREGSVCNDESSESPKEVPICCGGIPKADNVISAVFPLECCKSYVMEKPTNSEWLCVEVLKIQVVHIS